jgi:uncharacterized membrane protein
MPQLIELAAVLACTLFAGAAIYINLVEHPARLAAGTEIAVAQFGPSYRRATVMQVSLAVIAALSGMIRWLLGGGAVWIWAAVLIVTVIPFTLIGILPTNKRLLDPQLDRRSAEAQRLLDSWGRLHAVRSVLSLVASILFVWGATRP